MGRTAGPPGTPMPEGITVTITVLDYLSGRGAPYLVLPSPQAVNPEETAAAHDVSTDELVRTIAFRYRFGDAIAVVPWTRPVALDLVREALDDPEGRSLEPHELEGFANGCSPDSLPPLGLWLQAPMFVDVAVARLQQVVFAAGRPSLLVCMQRTELFRDDPYAVAVLTEASRAEAEAAGIVTSRSPREVTEEDLLPVHVVEERRRRAGRDRTDVA
jgi:prolyl-tRNA editing enzyme YbaK/EbsC (Cys-tRNA(Pro) deacylase)